MQANLISSLVIPLILTIIIEVFIAFLFGYKNKISILIIILINIITNPILNYLIILNNSLDFVSYNLVTLSFMEYLVIFIEWRMLVYALNNKCNKRLFLLSLTMNLVSFILGIILFRLY